MLKPWLEPSQLSVSPDFNHAIGGNPLVSQLLYKRGVTDIDSAKGFLYPDNYHPTLATELPGLEKMVGILQKAIEEKKKIGVWGDFDVDGQTATTVLVSALRDLGGNVIYHIPVRSTESHGISLPALKQFIKQGVDLTLTCDTGITSHDSIDYAQKQG